MINLPPEPDFGYPYPYICADACAGMGVGGLTVRLHFALFAPLVGTEFAFHPAGPGTNSVPLTLVHATQSGKSPDIEQFSLQWDGPAAPLLRQGTCRVTHPQLGEAEIFIVPIGRTSDGARYEAIFNVPRAG